MFYDQIQVLVINLIGDIIAILVHDQSSQDLSSLALCSRKPILSIVWSLRGKGKRFVAI